MKILVLDVGGSHVKMRVSRSNETRQFDSGPQFTPWRLVDRVREMSDDWFYDAITLGYPGVVGRDGPAQEPGNLGRGWVGFDFSAAFRVPVRVANDAILQALGGYTSGRMLFLGLGTGLGSALVTEHVVIPMELGNVLWGGQPLGDLIGRKGLETLGPERWNDIVAEAVPMLQRALAADATLLGGGNAELVDPVPKGARRGGNEDAFTGGLKLWEEMVEPHDRPPPPVWRVVQ